MRERRSARCRALLCVSRETLGMDGTAARLGVGATEVEVELVVRVRGAEVVQPRRLGRWPGGHLGSASAWAVAKVAASRAAVTTVRRGRGGMGVEHAVLRMAWMVSIGSGHCALVARK